MILKCVKNTFMSSLFLGESNQSALGESCGVDLTVVSEEVGTLESPSNLGEV